MSPSEILAVKSYEAATGENVVIPVVDADGKPTGDYQFAKGIDPGTLSAILDIVLSFIFGIVDKLREGGLCVRDPSTGKIVTGKLPFGVVGLPLSVEDRAKAVQDAAKKPKWRQRARLHRDLQNELKGTVDAWDMTTGMLSTVGANTNFDIVKGAIEEGEEPDYGWV